MYFAMKNLLTIVLALFCKVLMAQNKFSNCLSAFLDNKMMAEKYEPLANAHVSKNAIGELTVCTANISVD